MASKEPITPKFPKAESFYDYLATVGLSDGELNQSSIRRAIVVRVASIEENLVDLEIDGDIYPDVPVWIHTDYGCKRMEARETSTLENPKLCFERAVLQYLFPPTSWVAYYLDGGYGYNNETPFEAQASVVNVIVQNSVNENGGQELVPLGVVGTVRAFNDNDPAIFSYSELPRENAARTYWPYILITAYDGLTVDKIALWDVVADDFAYIPNATNDDLHYAAWDADGESITKNLIDSFLSGSYACARGGYQESWPRNANEPGDHFDYFTFFHDYVDLQGDIYPNYYNYYPLQDYSWGALIDYIPDNPIPFRQDYDCYVTTDHTFSVTNRRQVQMSFSCDAGYGRITAWTDFSMTEQWDPGWSLSQNPASIGEYTYPANSAITFHDWNWESDVKSPHNGYYSIKFFDNNDKYIGSSYLRVAWNFNQNDDFLNKDVDNETDGYDHVDRDGDVQVYINEELVWADNVYENYHEVWTWHETPNPDYYLSEKRHLMFWGYDMGYVPEHNFICNFKALFVSFMITTNFVEEWVSHGTVPTGWAEDTVIFDGGFSNATNGQDGYMAGMSMPLQIQGSNMIDSLLAEGFAPTTYYVKERHIELDLCFVPYDPEKYEPPPA